MTATLEPVALRSAFKALKRQVASGMPFALEACDVMAELPRAKLEAVLRSLRLRSQLASPFAEALVTCQKRVPDLHEVLRKPHRCPVSAMRLINFLRIQFEYLIQQAPPNSARRLRHVFQVHLQPGILRHRMRRFFGLTFLPTRRLTALPFGERFLPLDSCRVLSLASRLHVLPSGKVIDMYDIKVSALQVEPESGSVIVGGPWVLLAKYFKYPPHRWADRNTLSLADAATVEGGLALHEAMEQAAVNGTGIQQAPLFPRAFLAFRTRDELAVEYTETVQRRILREACAWGRRGRPAEWPSLPGLCTLEASLQRPPPRSWSELQEQVGHRACRFLQEQCWDLSITEFEGLFLTPLDHFEPYSAQRPVRRAARVYVQFEPHLLSRDMTLSDGQRTIGDTLARAQVISRHGFGDHDQGPLDEDGLCGSTGSFEYDFAAVPRGLERSFRPAGCSQAG
jgi:hypothetical protein